MRTAGIIAAALMVSVVAEAVAQSAVGWPDAVGQLAQERSQAQACVDLLKTAGDKTSIVNGRIAYGGAKAAADGVIAGLTVALVQGGNPADLPKMNANLEKAGAGLQEVCNDAISAAKASEGRGIVDEAVKAAVGPVVDALKAAAGALWTRHVEKDKLEIETIKGQLEAAKWPDFGP
jgi:hypothetical protein